MRGMLVEIEIDFSPLVPLAALCSCVDAVKMIL